MFKRKSSLKNILLITLFQLVFLTQSFAQNQLQKSSLVCSYQLSYRQDSTDAAIRKEYFKLVVSQGISVFQNPRSRMRDSLFSVMMGFIKQPEVMATYSKQVMSLSKESFKYIIYKNSRAKTLSYYDWVGSNLYHYEEMLPLFKWTISPEVVTIAGYTCQLATTVFAGRKFEAWFTREVPVSDGPYKFCGLPGLIIKVGDTRKQYTFELQSLTLSPSVPKPILPAHPSILTTKAELRRGKIAYQASLAGPPPSFGNIPARPTSATTREAVTKFNSKRNNPLELK